MKRLDEIGMSDKDRMSDALASQKFITGLYNTGANECEHMELKSDIMGIDVYKRQEQGCPCTDHLF